MPAWQQVKAEIPDREKEKQALPALIFEPISDLLEEVTDTICDLPNKESANSIKVTAQLKHVLSTSGKKMRPAITLATAQIWGKPADERVINMAIATELLHLATLVHDDTVDNADIRRGIDTASKVWGKDVAILLGDYIFAKSAIFVCNTHNPTLVRRFAETICSLARGELQELASAWNVTQTLDAYMELIKDKTASLFAIASESGATLGCGSDDDILRLHDYGIKLGYAYQIFDDISDYESSEGDLGKPAARDLEAGLITMPAIMAMESNPEAIKAVTSLMTAQPEDHPHLLRSALDEIRKSGGIEAAKQIGKTYLQEADDILDKLPQSPFLNSLRGVIEYCRLSASTSKVT